MHESDVINLLFKHSCRMNHISHGAVDSATHAKFQRLNSLKKVGRASPVLLESDIIHTHLTSISGISHFHFQHCILHAVLLAEHADLHLNFVHASR